MQEYVQKSTMTTFPRRRASVSGFPPAVLSQLSRPRNSGARGAARARRGGCERVSGAGQLAQLAPHRRVLLEPLLEGRPVGGKRGRHALVESEGDRQCPDAEEHARDLPCRRGVASQPPDAGREPLAADRDREHRNRGTDGVRRRDSHEAETDFSAGREHGDGSEDGACTGHEHETEAEAKHETVAIRLGATPRQEEERALEQPGDALREEARGHHAASPRSRGREEGPPAARARSGARPRRA